MSATVLLLLLLPLARTRTHRPASDPSRLTSSTPSASPRTALPNTLVSAAPAPLHSGSLARPPRRPGPRRVALEGKIHRVGPGRVWANFKTLIENRYFQSNWANLRILGQPCGYHVSQLKGDQRWLEVGEGASRGGAHCAGCSAPFFSGNMHGMSEGRLCGRARYVMYGAFTVSAFTREAVAPVGHPCGGDLGLVAGSCASLEGGQPAAGLRLVAREDGQRPAGVVEAVERVVDRDTRAATRGRR
jgi:hypothetical protein